MLDQSIFTETIHEVSEIIRVSQGNMTREEILGYFKDMDLNEEQQNMVLDFLLNPQPEEEPSADEETLSESSASEDTESRDESQADNSTENVQEDEEEAHMGVFRMYLDELGQLSAYSKEQQEEMYRALLAGEESVIAEITNCWLPVVLENAKKLTESNDPDCLQDVVQEGNMALFMCLKELCGSREAIDVESELAKEIESAMKSCILEEEGEGESEDAMVGRIALINEAVSYLEKENGTKPGMKELAEYTKVPAEELEEILLYIEKAKQKKK